MPICSAPPPVSSLPILLLFAFSFHLTLLGVESESELRVTYVRIHMFRVLFPKFRSRCANVDVGVFDVAGNNIIMMTMRVFSRDWGFLYMVSFLGMYA